jgi:hypothetical protein
MGSNWGSGIGAGGDPNGNREVQEFWVRLDGVEMYEGLDEPLVQASEPSFDGILVRSNKL